MASLLLCVLVASLALLRPGEAASGADSVFLLVSKSLKVKRISDKAEDITVSFSIYNTGSSIAYDVSLNDDVWPADAFEVVGNSSKTWEKVEGGVTVTHSFVVKPKEQGYFTPPPATVTFRVTSKTELSTAYSTPVPEIGLLQPAPQGEHLELLKELAEQYGPLVAAIAIVSIAGYIIFAPIIGGKKLSQKKKR